MTHAIVFGGVIAATGLLTSILRNWLAYAPAQADRVSWPKVVTLIPIAFGVFFAMRAAWGLFADEDPRWLFILVPGAVAIVLFLPALLRSDVVLADGKLSGPASLVGPFPWYSRNTIPLSEIRSVATAKYDYTFAEGADGRRVYIANGRGSSSAFIANLNAAREAARSKS